MKTGTAGDVVWRRKFIRLGLPAGLGLVAACAAGDSPPPRIEPTASVETLIGDAACDSDSQCHTIAIGAKACGGPERYLAWSSQHTDGAALQTAVARDAGAGRGRPGGMSNCALVTDPGAYCGAPETSTAPGAAANAQPSAERRCRLHASGPGGVARID